MNKYQKELIEKSKPYIPEMPFDYLYIIPSGKLYNGFWGKNGHNSIYIVCGVHKEHEDEYYLIGKDYQVDVLDFMDFSKQTMAISCDIPNKINCVRFFCLGNKEKFVVKDILSSIKVEIIGSNSLAKELWYLFLIGFLSCLYYCQFQWQFF